MSADPTASIALPAGSRVLVTGGTGLIGRTVLPLIADDVEVFAVSRSARESNGATWLARDLAQPGSMRETVLALEPHIVIHLAGANVGDRTLAAVDPTLTTNLVATVELLEAAARVNVSRIVVSGSLLEEPAGSDVFPIPPSPYGASRWASSAYASPGCSMRSSTRRWRSFVRRTPTAPGRPIRSCSPM